MSSLFKIKFNKLKTIKNTALGFLLLGLAATSYAEATIELYSDAGFPISPFTFDSAGFDAGFIDPQPPEGRTVMQLGISAPGGGMGMGNGGIPNRSGYSGGALRFQLKSTQVIKIEIEHTSPGTKSFADIPSTGNQWQEIVLPFDGSGTLPYRFNVPVNVNNVIAMFLASNFVTPGSNTWRFDHIRWTKQVASLSIFPKSTTVNPGQKRQFTIEGRDAAGENVIIYAPFSTLTAPTGSFNPGAPIKVRASTFTAATESGVALVTENAISTTAAINNTSASTHQQLGLLSETLPGILLDFDSRLLKAFGGGGGATDPITIDEVSSDNREGSRRFSTTILPQSSPGSFSGWFIQWSLNASDAFTRDMNMYYEGSIRFWFKGPPALQNSLALGIRSGNVAAGSEYSKVQLNQYVTFDNQWHSVAIPIRALAGAKPWADIARTKVLVSFFATGIVSGSQTFYLDNLRWDSRTPGPLASMGVTPNPGNVPLSGVRLFTAQGFDANGTTVDIYPTWSKSGNIGNISPTQGISTLLTASASPAAGTITATQGTFSSFTVVNVADPVWTQSFNVYSDAGSGGYVGVAVGVNPATTMTLSEQNLGGSAPEGVTVRRAQYTLANNLPGDAFAVWFTNHDASGGSRFMTFYEDGYLSFWVKTPHDLQIAIRSANIAPGTEKSKVFLSELGVPLNNQFQKVVISLADLKAREPLLDFNQIQTFFAVAALSSQIGQVSNQIFDIDDVKWLTASPGAPDENRVYTGLREKQRPSGLIRSFDTLPQAVTYDQAIVAMNFIYRMDLPQARNIFNVYQTKFNAGFNGFHDEYNVDNPNITIDTDRFAGPNAWMLLALMHYRTVSGDSQYDTMMDGIASWLRTLQAPDGAIRLGYVGSTLLNYKATEHAFDCYAAFKTYASVRADPTYITAANNIMSWLQNEMYVPAQTRFYLGEQANGLPDPDKALDVYSWAPLAVSSFSQVLATAVTDFRNSKVCDLTGNTVTGFDFGGLLAYPTSYTDAVWIEGTGQMALAYYATENLAQGDFYVQELEKSIINTSVNGQGMPYATNNGTGFGGFAMNSLNPAASSSAWYLFAKKKFNPFQPCPLYGVQIRNVSNHALAPSISWSASVPVRWVLANQYIKLEAQPVSILNWGVQVYTNNTITEAVPRYIDPTPLITINPDSDPAGLGHLIPNQSTTSYKIPFAWRIQDSTGPLPNAVAPYTVAGGGNGEAFNWFYFKDRATPAIDANGNGSVGDPEDGTAFSDGEDYITLRKPEGIHSSQGSNGYFPSLSPDYIYFEADHGAAAVGQEFRTNTLSIDFFLQ